MPHPIIALLTDFGTRDPYVGVMKGVIAGRTPPNMPPIQCIDITHDVRPQNIAQAAYLLCSSYRYFPAHTIFLAVVDPGVGTERRPVAINTAHGVYVGPDNGIFGLTLDEIGDYESFELRLPGPISQTFHGRDLFAPVAADLACGCSLADLGTPITDLLRGEILRMERIRPYLYEGEVIHIDSFGNIVTSLGPFDWQSEGGHDLVLRDTRGALTFDARKAQIRVGEYRIDGVQKTYGMVDAGETMALIGSDHQLEIAVNQGDAAIILDVMLGDTVQLGLLRS